MPANVTLQSGVDVQHVDTGFLASFYALARALPGVRFTVTSGWRSYAEQARLWARYVASGFNRAYIAAKPGTSNHERGVALDVWTDRGGINDAIPAGTLALYGLHGTVAGDKPHITPLAVSG